MGSPCGRRNADATGACTDEWFAARKECDYDFAKIPMAHADPTFRSMFWTQFRPILVAWNVDLVRMLLFWIGILAAHVTQRLALSMGWFPTIVHSLDIAEEVLVAISVVCFLLSSTVSFIWMTIRRTMSDIASSLKLKLANSTSISARTIVRVL